MQIKILTYAQSGANTPTHPVEVVVQSPGQLRWPTSAPTSILLFLEMFIKVLDILVKFCACGKK